MSYIVAIDVNVINMITMLHMLIIALLYIENFLL